MTESQNQEEAKTPKQELLILDPFQHQEAELKKLASDYTNYVVTEDNLKEAEAVRLKLWRIRVKEISKSLKERLEKIKEFKDEQETKAGKLCNIIQPVEEDLEKKIATVKAAKEKREREEKEREQKRIQGHREKLAELNKLALKINNMDLEELALVSIDWANEYNPEEFGMEFLQAKAAVLTAKTSRKELLDLRRKEELRKAAEEEAQWEKKQYEENFKALTEMLSDVVITEDLKKVEQYLEIGENAKKEAYGPNAAQAEGVLAALKMLATSRKEFLVKRAEEAVTVAPKEKPQEEERPKVMPASMSGHVPNRNAFATAQPEQEAPNMANHIPEMEEPEEEGPQNIINTDMDFDEVELNMYQYGIYSVGLSKNIPEKTAKSILNYCQHLLNK